MSFCDVHNILKQNLSVKQYYFVPLSTVLVLFVITAVLPAWSSNLVALDTSIIRRVDASHLVQQGRELYEAGQFSEAVAVWLQAARAYQTQNDVLNQTMVLSNLSMTYQQLGQWTQAKAAITDSLNLLQHAGNTVERLKILAQSLNTQGSLQMARGESQTALATWQRATAAYAQAGDDTGVTRSLINQAQALQALGLYIRTKALLTQVHQTLQKQPDSLLKAAGLRSFGNALRLVGDLDQSQLILQQSLTVAQHLKSPLDIGEALFSLGNTARNQQDTPSALAFYQQAITTSPSPSNRLQAELNQLSLLLEPERVSPDRAITAQALLPQIQSQLANLPPSRTAIYARIDFAQSLMKMGSRGDPAGRPYRLNSALLLATAVQQAKSLQDRRAEAYALGYLGEVYENQQLSNAQDLTQQALLLAQFINAPDIAYRWQWQLGRLLKVKGDIKGAIAAYTEAFNTLQSLRSDLVAVNPEVQFSFRDEVEPVYRELVDLLLRPEGISEPNQANLLQARQVMESLQLAELDNFFRQACLAANSVSIDRLVDQYDPTAAVVYPIILPDRVEVVLKLPKQPLRHYSTHVSQTEVEQTLEQLQQNIVEPDRNKDVKISSRKVYSWLIQPAAAELARSKVKTLVFVLDGPLRNISMAALYDGDHYLVEKYAVALSLGLQLLKPKSLAQGGLKALTAGLSEQPPEFTKFSPLPEVRSEFNRIQQAGVPTKELLNQQFTSSSLERGINSSPLNVIHLATHGQFSSQAKDTFILAWNGPINVSQLDSLLQNRQSRSGAVELLVLSACETATGDKRAALGLAGVAVRAGARSTLASLWHVDDRATSIFIGEFYRELIKDKATKAEALRGAQLSLLKDPSYSLPRYWAPYVLIGNWL